MRNQDKNAIAFVVVFVFLTASLGPSLLPTFHTGGPEVALGFSPGSSTTTSTSSALNQGTTVYVTQGGFSPNSYSYGGGGGGGSSPTTTSTSFTTTTTSTTSTFTTTTGSGSFWNNRSQAVADYLIKYGWDQNVGLLHDTEPGCRDYVGYWPCDNTFWTTSDNVPTCWTLTDFHYALQGETCIQKTISLGAFLIPNSGMRYEAYAGYPIITGNPGDQHTILLPPNGATRIVCTGQTINGTQVWPNCQNIQFGTLSNGQPYGIQSDAWSGQGRGKPNPNAGVDIAAPQAINAWLRGNLATYTAITKQLILTYTSTNYVGSGSVWQLGQVMFVMRIGGYDNTTAFLQMQNMLWSLQSSQGYLPNQYSGFGQPGQGRDPENQDAGLLPYSNTVISMIQADFGKFNASSPPQ